MDKTDYDINFLEVSWLNSPDFISFLVQSYEVRTGEAWEVYQDGGVIP